MIKLLLDESIPIRLAYSFPECFEVATVRAMGWSGTKNGKLIMLAGENGFSALITADKNIGFQQNIDKLPCAIVVLQTHRTRLQELLPLIPKITALFKNKVTGIHYINT